MSGRAAPPRLPTIGREIVRVARKVLTSLPGRIVVTLLLLALVARSIDWSTIGTVLTNAAWGWFVLAVAAIIGGFLVAAARWQRLLAAGFLRVPLGTTVRAYFVGTFANSFLPTGFGGDVVRAWMVAGSGRPLARALTSVGVDRVTALGCLVLVGWIGIAVDPDAVPLELTSLLAVVSAAGFVLLTTAMVLIRRRPGHNLIPAALRPWAAEVVRVLGSYESDRALQAKVIALGVVFQALTVAAFWLLSETIDLDLDPALLAVVAPLVLIATLLPISIAGFGVREGAFVLLLAEANVPAGQATLLSLLSVAAMTVASLPGGVSLLIGRDRLAVSSDALERRMPSNGPG